jgi:hypothetical protein
MGTSARTSISVLSALALLSGVGCDSAPPALDRPASGPLVETDYDEPWVVIDRVGSGRLIASVAHGPAGYVAATYDSGPTAGGFAVSPDGVSWDEGPLDPEIKYQSVTYGAGLYVAVGGPQTGRGGIALIP